MRTFENKLTTCKEVQENGSLKVLTYSDLVRACTDRIPKEGLVTSEQKKRLNVQCLIHDKLKVGDKVKIEGDVYETLRNCVVGFRWFSIHQDLCDFEDYVVGLKEK